MSERAYSEELRKEISAIEAYKKSLDGSLKSAKAFRCHDTKCRIKLTCSNWKINNAKRLFFTPSNRDELHSVECSTVTYDEEKYQVKIETKQGKGTIIKNGIIDMRRATMTSKPNNGLESITSNDNISKNIRRNNVSKDKEGTENRNVSSIKTYINFYYDNTIDNDLCNIRVDGEIISLNTLFVDAKQEMEEGVNRIFFGNAIVKTAEFNKEIVSLEFVDANKSVIYTNKEKLLTRISSRILNKYLDNNEECRLYFRGSIDNNGKFISFNGKNYCDICIMEIE